MRNQSSETFLLSEGFLRQSLMIFFLNDEDHYLLYFVYSVSEFWMSMIKVVLCFSRNIKFPLKNLSTVPAEFQWNSTGVMENYWKMTGTNGTSGIPLNFRWNSSSS